MNAEEEGRGRDDRDEQGREARQTTERQSDDPNQSVSVRVSVSECDFGSTDFLTDRE